MIEKIKKNRLCLGCGLCSSVVGQEKCEMRLVKTGFYEPEAKKPFTSSEEKAVKQLCPAVHVEARSHVGVWGNMLSACEAWSADAFIRHKAASGGVTTSLAIFALEHHLVDAVLQVGVRSDSYIYNELQVSRSREDILRNAQSRYAPALVFHQIKTILDSSSDLYAFIGKPCDIAAMQNLVRMCPQYKGRIKYFLSIFCAGMPSYNATLKAWQQSGHKDTPVALKYRGDGWPGKFTAQFDDGSTYQMTYNESWGKILGRDVAFRCKICPDGIGLLADIAIGDSWNTKDGYPDFTESDGKCFCMVRTKDGASLMDAAAKEEYIKSRPINLQEVKNQQPYQYKRRKLAGWRLLPVQVMTGWLLHFEGLNLLSLALTANLRKGFRDMCGTYKRFRKELHGK
ncbi:MAG: Coenzyme F420 hydrogenase/dehydrogenase, beta subunit C-terminal domain [Bacteroidaceae bacterium]|nr:Coenzyme F420 hydrogenase/dehydrogenase, beta subunit C-terminal domain [Bacteroidaceae bacterium]